MAHTIHCNHPNDKLSQGEIDIIQKRMLPGDFSKCGFLKEGEHFMNIIAKDNETLRSMFSGAGITHQQIVDRLTTLIKKYELLNHLIDNEKYTSVKKMEIESIYDEQIRLKVYIQMSNENYPEKKLTPDEMKLKIQELDEITKLLKQKRAECESIYKQYMKNGGLIIDGKYLMHICSYRGSQQCPFKNNELDPRYHGYDYGCSDVTITNLETNKTITFGTLLLHMIEYHQFFEGNGSLIDQKQCDNTYRLDPSEIVELLELKPNVDYKHTKVIKKLWRSSCSFAYSSKYTQNQQINALAHYSLINETFDSFLENMLIQKTSVFLFPEKVAEKIRDNYVGFIEGYLNNKTYDELLHHILRMDENEIEEDKQIIQNFKTNGALDNMAIIKFGLRDFKKVVEVFNKTSYKFYFNFRTMFNFAGVNLLLTSYQECDIDRYFEAETIDFDA